MQKIRRNNIYLTRGDTLFVKVTPILSNGKEYTLKKGDVITFTVKKTTGDDDDILIQRTTENGIINITPFETKQLDYGEYVYDCQLTTADGYVNTFVTPHALYVQEEVTP